MRILEQAEIDQVSGGLGWFSALAWGATTGVAGNYIYDSLGGFDGINAGIAFAFDSISNSALIPVPYSS